ncbi:SseB family protein [Actinoplanes subtropicus]|uniref:SseB family protein n=1 Tax=Actinoplanes subtropicus TaxID=543632 RepID=UPI000B039923|nr:SseB family protein [Actinoplanes subtropicus]
MSEWEPATDAEVAMRDALRTDDQESYFRILAGVDLLLPVSADALQGLAPLGWGTWSTGGRTHVLAFTSTAALQACLADYSGSARRVPYAELANTWPNLEWWLAVNPGLPIEGYLPAWFVAQLSRGDLRLPTRGPGRDKSPTPGRIQDLHSAAIAANEAAAQHEASAAQPVTGPPAAAPVSGHPRPMSAPPASAPPASVPPRPMSVPAAASAAYPQPVSAPPVAAPSRLGSSPAGSSLAGSSSPASLSPASLSGPMAGPPGYAQAAAATRMPQLPAADEKPEQAQASASSPLAPPPEKPQIGPGGLPIRSPGGVMPSGLPSRAPASAAPISAAPTSALPASALPTSAVPTSAVPTSAVPTSATPAQAGPPPAGPASVPSAYRPPTLPPESTTGGWATFGPGEDPRGPLQDPSAPLPVRTPMANTPPVPEHLAGQTVDEPPLDPRWNAPLSAQARPDLPRRQAAPTGDDPARGGFPQGPASPQAAAQHPGLAQHPGVAQRPGMAEQRPGMAEQHPGVAEQHPDLAAQYPGLAQRHPGPGAPQPGPAQPAPGFGSPLPRRQTGPASEPAPMTSFPAFKTPAERAATAEAQAAGPAATRPGLAPPVIPGAPGSDRPARLGAQPQQPSPLEVRGAAPVPPSRPAGPPPPAESPVEPFVPANDVERELFHAADRHNTDQFLSTLLLASVLVPVAHHSRPGSAPGESGFAFRTEEMEGETYLIVFTSRDRLADHYAEPTRTVSVRFYELIRNWPDPVWSFAVNPGGPIGAKYPGPQVIALANWAAEAGLGADAEHDEPVHPVPAPAPANDDAQHATVMQKTVPPEHVDFYLERGYDRVAGFVHRATEVEHLRTPAELFGALGLTYAGSTYQPDAKEAYVLRWPAYRPSLYRIPYGGQNEQALKAMDGWVIERAPFRGNGFAPGEGRDVIAEFKVDSVRLPHGAQLWRIDADGSEHMIAIFDNDGPQWRRVGEQ